jgi:hypothetical protein
MSDKGCQNGFLLNFVSMVASSGFGCTKQIQLVFAIITLATLDAPPPFGM